MAKPLFDDTSARAANLLDLIEVSQGGIVSKTLVESVGIKQVLFSMDADQEISEHRSPYIATVHVLDGGVHVRVGAQDFELSAGAWLLMPANVPHGLRAHVPCRFLLTLLKGGSAPAAAAQTP
jgi:quercetin dioxygenase-like cupin family protein